MTQSPDAHIEAITFEASGLGDRSYLVHDGEVAVVVDPQRDQERYIAAAEQLGVRITHVFETHIHNDYVSGGLGLAREVDARYVLPEGEQLAFAEECSTLGDGESLTTGSLTISALSTPGHTPHHLSYLLRNSDGGTAYVCTGGSVLPGGVGRTDLLGADRAAELATAQWASVRRLLTELDDSTAVLPTHGFGSFCSATPTVGSDPGTLTVAVETHRNPAMTADMESFARSLISDPPPIPAYYQYMAPMNRSGVAAPRYERVVRIDEIELNRLLRAGGIVTDLRPRRSFAAAHRRGSTNIELGTNLTTYFGWVLPFDQPYTLIAMSLQEIEESRRLLARIGREEVAGYLLVEDLDLAGSANYPVATFEDLARVTEAEGQPHVIDIRHASEWREGHLAQARHIALPDLEAKRSTLPTEQELWVHCAAGFRAAIAASQLSAWGLHPVLIDDAFEHASEHGLQLEIGGS